MGQSQGSDEGMAETLSESRQWPTCIREVSDHHLRRYEFAASIVSGRVLDAACGAGYGAWLMFSNRANVVGVDSNKKAILWARSFFPGPIYLPGGIEETPWLGKFDWIVSLETLEHVPDASVLLRIFRESCAGGFVFSVPNEEHYPFKAENYASDDSPHFRHYTPGQFGHLLEETGFKITKRFCQRSKAKPAVENGTDGKFLIYVCS